MVTPWFGAHIVVRTQFGCIPINVAVPDGPDAEYRAAVVARVIARFYLRRFA